MGKIRVLNQSWIILRLWLAVPVCVGVAGCASAGTPTTTPTTSGEGSPSARQLGKGASTYVDTMRWNVNKIVESLR